MDVSVAADGQLPEQVDLPQNGEDSIRDVPSIADDISLQLPADSQDDARNNTDTQYWDVPVMAPLNAASALMRTKAAIARLRAYKPPPFPLWDRLPLSRRAAVLMLLYADKRGDLRVVITMRATSLRSFSGHAALPGGKADSLEETPYQIARREAWEEIGLPMDDTKIPPPFRIEHLCYLPMNLARTELVVRPCVALLHTTDPPIPTASISSSASASTTKPTPSAVTTTVEESLMPRLDAKEVAAVFSAPFHNFLKETDEPPPLQEGEGDGRRPPLPEGNWYEGSWTTWHEEPWRMHFFYVPVTNQRVVKPMVPKTVKNGGGGSDGVRGDGSGGLAALAENGGDGTEQKVEESTRYKVWGMTARMLVDAATVAYGEKPEFEHNRHFGDEGMIEALDAMGRLGEKKKPGSLLSDEDLKRARDASEAGRKAGAGGGGVKM